MRGRFLGFLFAARLAYCFVPNIHNFLPTRSLSRGWAAIDDVSLPLIRSEPDPQQAAAISSTDLSVLVIAGPGSGKTRVLAARLSYLLLQCICSSRDILVLSFTRNGAYNLRSRADDILAGTVASTEEVNCQTFHSFCKDVLDKYMHLLSNKKYMIADDNYQLRIMMEIMVSKGKTATASSANALLRQIRLWKELGLGYLGIRKKSFLTSIEDDAYEVYPEYQRKLVSLSSLDFGDLLLNTLKLFRAHPNVLEEYRARYTHILVDEFQDVSPAQYDILQLLSNGYTKPSPSAAVNASVGIIREMQGDAAAAEPLAPFPPATFTPSVAGGLTGYRKRVHVFCAGDDDQSIYAWRGAQIQLMRRFKYDFPAASIHRFETTYRLPDSLCQATSSIAAGLSDRIPKTLRAAIIDTYQVDSSSVLGDSALSPSIFVRQFTKEHFELQWIAKQLQQRMIDSRRTNEGIRIAVLAGSAASQRLLEKELNALRIPYSNRGRRPFVPPVGMEAPMNLLRLFAMPHDSLAFESALLNDIILASMSNTEVKNLLLPQLRSYAEARQIPHFEAARECVLKGLLDGRMSKALSLFIGRYDSWKKELVDYFAKGENGRRSIHTILMYAFHNSWSKQFSKATETIANHLSSFDSLKDYFDTASSEDKLEMDTERLKRANVQLMTMQAAKGLEFDEVFLPQWTQEAIGGHDSEDERRLAFVSLTRARRFVHVTYSNSRVDGPSNKPITLAPSKFIAELVNAGSRGVQVDVDEAPVTFTSAELEAEDIGMAADIIDMNLKSLAKATTKKQTNLKKGLSSLPRASALTVADVKALMTDASFRKSDVKLLLREALSLRGFKRGTISVRISGSVFDKRALSSCTVPQLGDFLITEMMSRK